MRMNFWMRNGSWLAHWLRCVFALLALSVVCAAGAETRLAIISPDPASEPLSDLLTAELSQEGGLVILERAELNRAWREASLKDLGAGSLKKAGALIQADALAIVDAHPISKGFAVKVRVVAVQSGAALGWWENSVSNDQLGNWARTAAGQIKGIVKKISARSPKLAAISFVGFASPATGSDAARLEREINGLFLSRLGAEPGVVVLERQKLLEASLEKALGQEDQTFWNGAYVIDGTINPTEVSGEKVEVSVRLTQADGTTHSFKLTGSRDALADLSNEFVGQVLKRIDLAPQARAFDPEGEANRYFEEAKLALRSGFWREAMAASDTAVALGRNDDAAKVVRLQAYTGFLTPDYRERFFEPVNPKFGVLEHYGPAISLEVLNACIEAAYQLRDLAPKVGGADETLRRVLRESAEGLGAVGLRFYFSTELRAGKEDQLEQFRAAMKSATIQILSEYKKYVSAKPVLNENLNDLFALLAQYAPLWGTTPEEGVELRRHFLTLPGWFGIEEKIQVLNRLYWVPQLCGWKWEDRRRTEKAWEQFEEEERYLTAAAGRLQAIGAAASDAMVVTNATRALEYFKKEKGNLSQVAVRTAFADLLQNAWNIQAELVAPEVRDSLLKEELAALKPILKEIDAATATRGVEMRQMPLNTEVRPVDQISLAISKGKVPSRSLLNWVAMQNRSNKERALVLLRKLRDFPNSPEKEAILPQLNAQIAMLERQLDPTKKAQVRVASTLTKSVPASNANLPVITANRVPLVSTNTVIFKVAWDGTLFWLFEQDRSSRMWSNTVRAGSGSVHQYYLGTVEGGHSGTGAIQIPGRYFSFQQQPEKVEMAAVDGKVMLLLLNQVAVLSAGQFTSVPAPIQSGRLFNANGKVIFYNAETILEAGDGLTNFTVMASVRRRPAMNPLDLLPSFEGLRIAQMTNGALAFSIGGEAYGRSKDGWEKVPRSELKDFSTGMQNYFDFIGFRVNGAYEGHPFTISYAGQPHSKAKLAIAVAPGQNLEFDLRLPGRELNSNAISFSNATVAGGDIYIWSSHAPGLWRISGNDLRPHLNKKDLK